LSLILFASFGLGIWNLKKRHFAVCVVSARNPKEMKGLLTAQNNMRRHDALIIAAKKETTTTTIQNQTTETLNPVPDQFLASLNTVQCMAYISSR
jgi:hypothetical protein